MTALYFDQAVVMRDVEYVTLTTLRRFWGKKRWLVALRSDSVFSFNDMLDLQRLELERLQARKWSPLWRRIVRELAALHTYDYSPDWPLELCWKTYLLGRHWRKRSELDWSTSKEKEETPTRMDLGLLLGRLQKYFGGRPKDWENMPKYMVHAYTRVADKDAEEMEKQRQMAEAGRGKGKTRTTRQPLTKALGV